MFNCPGNRFCPSVVKTAIISRETFEWIANKRSKSIKRLNRHVHFKVAPNLAFADMSYLETSHYMKNSTFDPPPFLSTSDQYKTTYTNDYDRYGSQLNSYNNSASNPAPPFLTGSNSGFPFGTALHAMTPVGSLPTSSFVQKNSMYTPNQWRTSNIQNVTNGERERATAERLRDECARLRTETAIRTNRTQLDVNNKLDGRITDVNFWKEELNRQHREIVEEIKMLQQFIGRLERALAATEKPLNVTRQNLDYRTRRVKIDLVHDNVEEVLIKVRPVFPYYSSETIF